MMHPIYNYPEGLSAHEADSKSHNAHRTQTNNAHLAFLPSPTKPDSLERVQPIVVHNKQNATSRIIFESPDIRFGLWECPPESQLWSIENTIGPAPVIALPWTAVVIDRNNRSRSLMDPNSVAYYCPNELYKRQLASTKGDLCGFVSPSLPLLTTILEEAGLDTTNNSTPFKVGPAVSWATAAHHKLARLITDNNPPPDLVTESVLIEIARETILAAASNSRRKPRQYRSGSTARAHTDIANRTREVLARSVSDTAAEQVRLEDLSRQVHVSTYHLCRIFKQQTGESIAQHYLRLRLRTAAARLAWSDHTITSIAHDFGFANHAHFTTAWKAEFGYPPSALRSTDMCFNDRARN